MSTLVAVRAVLALLAAMAAARALAKDPVVIPMPYYEEDDITVPVTINGRDHIFTIETAATATFMDVTFRPQLGESIGEATALDLFNHPISTQVFNHPEAYIGGIPIPQSIPVYVYDFAPIRASQGRETEGTLGVPFFLSNIVQFSFDTLQIKIFPRSTSPAKEWGKPIKVTFGQQNLPTVKIKVFDLPEETFIVNTGYNNDLAFRGEFFDSVLKKGKLKNDESTKVNTARETEAAGTRGDLEEFEWGGKIHKNLVVIRAPANYIGLHLLRNYTVTFDLPHKKIFFAPSKNDLPPRAPDVGLHLLRLNGALEVRQIEPNSSALRAGFQVDDELVAFNTKDVKEKPIAEINWLMRRSVNRGEAPTAVVRRNGELITLTFPASSAATPEQPNFYQSE